MGPQPKWDTYILQYILCVYIYILSCYVSCGVYIYKYFHAYLSILKYFAEETSFYQQVSMELLNTSCRPLCRHQEAAKSCWEVWGPHQRKWWGTRARLVVEVVTCGSTVRLVSGDFKYLFDPTSFFVSNFVEVVDRSSSKKKKGEYFCHLPGGTMKSPCFLGVYWNSCPGFWGIYRCIKKLVHRHQIMMFTLKEGYFLKGAAFE